MKQQSLATSDYIFIHYLRVIAMVLILWDHLVPSAYAGIGLQPPVSIIERYIIWPLAITNYFGAFGVDLFFLITGFLTLFALKETNVIRFLVKRVFKLGPAIIFGYMLYYVLLYIAKLLGFDVIIDFSAYWTVGPLWYIRVLVCFYIVFSCCIPLFKRSLLGGLLLFQAISLVFCELSKRAILPFNLGNTCSYIFYITIGMAIYLLFVKKSLFIHFLLCFCVSWFGIVYYNIGTFNPERADTGNSFGVSAMYAILFFLVFLLANHLLPENKAVRTASEYSYGMYLHHMPIFSIVLPVLSHPGAWGSWVSASPDDALTKMLCYTAVSITLILTIGASYVQNKWIDPPSSNLLKFLLGRLR